MVTSYGFRHLNPNILVHDEKNGDDCEIYAVSGEHALCMIKAGTVRGTHLENITIPEARNLIQKGVLARPLTEEQQEIFSLDDIE